MEMTKSPLDLKEQQIEPIVPVEDIEDEEFPLKRYNTRSSTRVQTAAVNERVADFEEAQNEVKVPEEILATYNSIDLTRSDLERANEGEFLNDNVIDFYLYYIVDKIYEKGAEGKPKVSCSIS
jgi:Ulp1 family protease